VLPIHYRRPERTDRQRRRDTKRVREEATDTSVSARFDTTTANNEETAYTANGDLSFIANFSKGLIHDEAGAVHPIHYRTFVRAINQDDHGASFDTVPRPSRPWRTQIRPDAGVRDWESPRAGHIHDLQGPDAAAVQMAPAPRLDHPYLWAEMAEVYCMALLRDTKFSDFDTDADVATAITALQPLFTNAGTPGGRPRRGPVNTTSLFRGNGPGDPRGPYISQFLLVGSAGRNGRTEADGFLSYGQQEIDMRIQVGAEKVDYLTHWNAYLDAQDGADFRGMDTYEPTRRFVQTPRDLATYVHFDQLYQAYLNAALWMLEAGVPTDAGLPLPATNRAAFASFGGPHLLSLVTEVASRALKAVRRQKFNFHRRARPEAVAGLLELYRVDPTHPIVAGSPVPDLADALEANGLLQRVATYNQAQNNRPGLPNMGDDAHGPATHLLPMAFPEGSPMHPSYGAGHATVAGACVTILKAFFDTDRDMLGSNGGTLRYEADPNDPTQLRQTAGPALRIDDELDKLAANISIGRNMAGVHYFSDYHDSLRLGEDIALGLLDEQRFTYDEPVRMTLRTFDGRTLTIS